MPAVFHSTAKEARSSRARNGKTRAMLLVLIESGAKASLSHTTTLRLLWSERNHYWRIRVLSFRNATLLSCKEWDFALVKTPEEAAKVDELYLAKEYDGNAFQKESVPIPKPWQLYRNEDGTLCTCTLRMKQRSETSLLR